MYCFGMPVTVMIEWISCGAGKGYTTWKYEDGSSQMRYFTSSHTSKAMMTIAASIINSGE